MPGHALLGEHQPTNVCGELHAQARLPRHAPVLDGHAGALLDPNRGLALPARVELIAGGCHKPQAGVNQIAPVLVGQGLADRGQVLLLLEHGRFVDAGQHARRGAGGGLPGHLRGALLKRVAEVVVAGVDLGLGDLRLHAEAGGGTVVVVLAALGDLVPALGVRDPNAVLVLVGVALLLAALDAGLDRCPDGRLHLVRTPAHTVGDALDLALREEVLRPLVEFLVPVVEGESHPHVHRGVVLVDLAGVDLLHQVRVEIVGLDTAPVLAPVEPGLGLLAHRGREAPGGDRLAGLPLVPGLERRGGVGGHARALRVDGQQADELLGGGLVPSDHVEHRAGGVLVPVAPSLALAGELLEVLAQDGQLLRRLADPVGRADVAATALTFVADVADGALLIDRRFGLGAELFDELAQVEVVVLAIEHARVFQRGELFGHDLLEHLRPALASRRALGQVLRLGLERVDDLVAAGGGPRSRLWHHRPIGLGQRAEHLGLEGLVAEHDDLARLRALHAGQVAAEAAVQHGRLEAQLAAALLQAQRVGVGVVDVGQRHLVADAAHASFGVDARALVDVEVGALGEALVLGVEVGIAPAALQPRAERARADDRASLLAVVVALDVVELPGAGLVQHVARLRGLAQHPQRVLGVHLLGRDACAVGHRAVERSGPLTHELVHLRTVAARFVQLVEQGLTHGLGRLAERFGVLGVGDRLLHLAGELLFELAPHLPRFGCTELVRAEADVLGQRLL